MTASSPLKFIGRFLRIGTQYSQDRDEIKNIRLLNAGCIAWLPLNIVFIIEDLLLNDEPWANVGTFAGTALILLLVMLLQHKNRLIAARSIFLAMALFHFVAFALILEPGSFLEYFLLLIPVFATLFFKKFLFSLVSFIASFATFAALMNLFEHYPGVEIQNIANFALFFAIYLAFAYMKNLNLQSEKTLEKQRNQALEDKKKIDQQHAELAELHKFQSHFWVNLSHELRTPLTLIKGGVSQLKKGQWNEEQFQRIEENTEKMRLLIDNIMDLAKMRSKKLELKPQPIDLVEVLTKLMSAFEPVFYQKGISQALDLPESGAIFTNADLLYLDRAFSNILMNAAKYTEVQGQIRVKLCQDGAKAIIQFEDTGCGIPEDEQAHIFDTFYRANNTINQAGGSGVGLSFTKEVIELLGGTISVASVVDKGTTFKIELPLVEVALEHIPAPAPVASAVSRTTKASILIVEDNKDMRTYLKELLPGFTIHEASNGREGVAFLEEQPVDLILTDFMMPELNGYEFIHTVRKKGNSTPVIVLTARADEKAKLDFLRLGIDDYLNKPFNEEELLIRIQHSLHNNQQRLEELEKEEDKNVLDRLDKDLQPLITLVQDHLKSSTFGVGELADHMAMTERTLHRKIKGWTGLTPNEFIREIRLQRALRLVENQSVNSIKELTQEIGLVNSGHVAKLYEERFGTKPQFNKVEFKHLQDRFPSTY